MRRGEDKISIRKDLSDGHYVYYSFRDETDNGSILDFVMRRQERNFGKARQILRLWSRRIACRSALRFVAKSGRPRRPARRWAVRFVLPRCR